MEDVRLAGFIQPARSIRKNQTMDRIDAIMDLAKSMEPGVTDSEIHFKLWNDGKKWNVWVAGERFYIDAKGDSHEDVLEIIFQDLMKLNQSIVSRAKARMARWANSSNLRLVSREHS